ncbi:MAG: hypothetical protein K0Q58_988, partial [Microbacterium sp.]|nr:hypothetical protein [Microbacterium sp.]
VAVETAAIPVVRPRRSRGDAPRG